MRDQPGRKLETDSSGYIRECGGCPSHRSKQRLLQRWVGVWEWNVRSSLPAWIFRRGVQIIYTYLHFFDQWNEICFLSFWLSSLSTWSRRTGNENQAPLRWDQIYLVKQTLCRFVIRIIFWKSKCNNVTILDKSKLWQCDNSGQTKKQKTPPQTIKPKTDPLPRAILTSWSASSVIPMLFRPW